MRKKANPDCPLCHGHGIIVKDEFQKSSPECHLCFPQEPERLKSSPTHQQQEIEVPREILEWIDKSSYHISFGIAQRAIWKDAAIDMYRHLAPEITQLRQAAEILKMVRNESPTLKEM